MAYRLELRARADQHFIYHGQSLLVMPELVRDALRLNAHWQGTHIATGATRSPAR
jgi:hypothetical protein